MDDKPPVKGHGRGYMTHFYRAMLAWCMLSCVRLCLSVRVSQVGAL